MSDTTTLTAAELADLDLADWRYVLGRLKARFRSADFASGLALVRGLDGAGDDGRLEVLLSAGGVVVAVGRGGVTSTDVATAERIGAVAADLGLTADPGGITQLELGLDTAAPEHLAPFYAALLGGEVVNGEPVDPSGQVPTVWWQTPDPADEYALPDPVVPQRWHFDVWVAPDEGPQRLAAVLDAGGRLVSDAAAPSYWVVEDADGNRSCICTPADR